MRLPQSHLYWMVLTICFYWVLHLQFSRNCEIQGFGSVLWLGHIWFLWWRLVQKLSHFSEELIAENWCTVYHKISKQLSGFEFRVVLFLDWFPTKGNELCLLCYLTYIFWCTIKICCIIYRINTLISGRL